MTGKRVPHRTYLSSSDGQDRTGPFGDMNERREAARIGSEKLLAAILRYYKRRVAP